LANMGVIRPVDEIIDRIGRDDYQPQVIDALTLDGATWSVPFAINAHVLWYRSDLYQENGLVEATNWEEFATNVETLHQAGQQQGAERYYGIALGAGDNWMTNDFTQNWLWTNGTT